MAGRTRWCDHVAAATALVDCNGERHRVTWRRGKVVLENHDLTAETAMLAFGGKPFACLGVLRRWRDMHTWAMSGELFRQMQSRLGPDVVLPGHLKPVHELGLMLTWERNWRRSSYFADYGRLLLEEVRKRAEPPLREHMAFWRKRSGARLLSSVQVTLRRPGQPPSLLGSMDNVRASVTAALGVSWVLTVWARGLAVVEGALVLQIEEEAPESTHLRVRAVRWVERGGAWAPVAATALVGTGAEGNTLSWEE